MTVVDNFQVNIKTLYHIMHKYANYGDSENESIEQKLF